MDPGSHEPETTYMMISDSGNAIGSWTDRADACEAALEVLWDEPEAMDSFSLLAFNEDGMAVRRLWPNPEKKPSS